MLIEMSGSFLNLVYLKHSIFLNEFRKHNEICLFHIVHKKLNLM